VHFVTSGFELLDAYNSVSTKQNIYVLWLLVGISEFFFALKQSALFISILTLYILLHVL